MHVVKWPRVDVDILLNGIATGHLTFWRHRFVIQSEGGSHHPVADFHGNGEPDIEEHGSNNGVSHGREPIHVEVRVIAFEYGSHEVALLRQVGVAEHQQETCVEEDTDENTVGDVLHLLRLC